MTEARDVQPGLKNVIFQNFGFPNVCIDLVKSFRENISEKWKSSHSRFSCMGLVLNWSWYARVVRCPINASRKAYATRQKVGMGRGGEPLHALDTTCN